MQTAKRFVSRLTRQTLALVLAVGFFYLTNDDRRDRRAEAVTQAAASADEAVQAMGDAARNAADDLDRAR